VFVDFDLVLEFCIRENERVGTSVPDMKEPNMEKGMKGTNGLSGLPEDLGYCTQNLVRYSTKEGNT
jgi:hypothetical protein